MSMKRKPDHSPEKIRRRAAIDALEPRRMLAVFNGTSGNDVISISVQIGGGSTIVQINGSNNLTADPSITINAGVGNDVFRVFNTRSGTTVLARGDSGNDTLVNPGLLDVDAVYDAGFVFEGGAGIDTVVADNGEDTTTPYTINVRGYDISKSNVNTLLEYGGVESVEYRDSNGSNLIQFESLEVSGVRDVALAIHGNGGNDTIFNSSTTTESDGSWPSSIGTGGLLADGGTGVDTLLLSNTNPATITYTFNTNTVDAGQGTVSHGLLTHSNCETIDCVSSGINDFVRVFSKLSGAALRFNSGGGNDTFTVGNNDFDGSGIRLSNTTFLGGPGTDSFTVEDAADTDAAGELENYSLNVNTFIKGAAGFNFSEFENQTLRAANGLVPGFNTVPRVDLNATASTVTSTTIIGGAARMCRVDVGAGTLNNINGTVTLDLGGGPLDQVNINNTVPNVNTAYTVGQSGLSAPKTINYSGATAAINAGSVDDTFFIDGTATGTTLVANGNAGNDTFHVGGGNLGTNLLGPVTCNGGAGPNRVIVDNTTDASLATQTLNGATFIDGQSHTFGSLVNLTINGGPGGTNLAVNATAFQTDLNGGSGNDSYDIGGGDIDANLLPTQPLVINGAGGTDSIRLDDRNDTNLNGFINFRRLIPFIDQLFIDDINDFFVNWTGIERATFDASNAENPGTGNSASFIVVADMATPLTINGNGGPDSIQVQDAFSPVTVHTGPGENDSLVSNADLDANPGAIVVQQSDTIRDLHIFAGGSVRISDSAVLNHTGDIPGRLTINGVLDLAGGALLHSGGGTPLDFFQTRLVAGRNGGTWDGTSPAGAINSSTAASSSASDGVGYGLGAQIAISSLGGFTVEPTDVLVRHTLDGDADLSGNVNLADFNRLAANFGQPTRVWSDGDFNYDGTVNLADFNALAGNFGQALPAATASLPRPADAGDRWGDDEDFPSIEQL